MKRLLFAVALAGLAPAALAQTRPATTPQPGSASVKTQLQALHYNDVRDLRRGPDGQWVGKAMQNGVPKTITIGPDSAVTAR